MQRLANQCSQFLCRNQRNIYTKYQAIWILCFTKTGFQPSQRTFSREAVWYNGIFISIFTMIARQKNITDSKLFPFSICISRNVFPSIVRSDLSRPMRLLAPPARIIIEISFFLIISFPFCLYKSSIKVLIFSSYYI